MTLTRIARLAVLASFAGCASAGPLEPDAIFRHPTTAKLSLEDQQRYETDLERMAKERADSIRPR